MWTDTKRIRVYLGVSFVLRLLYALRFSYLHPDEHLQGPQEIAHGSYGWASQTPWEFTDEHPVRSFVPLWLIYGIPMGFFSVDTDPVYVLYTLRGVFTVLTWVLEDMAVDRLAATRNDKVRSLFFASTAYVTLTWQSHTLSNSFETILVLWYLVILFEAEAFSKIALQSFFDRHYDSGLLGIIVVLGIFNRPTIIAFLLLPSLTLLKLWYRNPAVMLTFSVSAALTCAGCIYVDTLLYGNQQGWVVTPLNFVKYNLSSSNLGTHGIHSRFTHLLVNLPQLLGPGLLLLRPDWFSLSMQTVISALAVLSAAPHQEARFLLPLIPLLCSQMDFEQFSSLRVRKIMLHVWLAFNVVLGIVMGLFHQAGVIPAQIQIREIERPATVVWWSTYTPPLWVTGLQTNQIQYAELSVYGLNLDGVLGLIGSSRPETDVLTELDLQGADEDILKQVLSRSAESDDPFYFVAPLAKQAAFTKALIEAQVTANLEWKTFFHLDPTLLDVKDPSSWKLGLGIWRMSQLA